MKIIAKKEENMTSIDNVFGYGEIALDTEEKSQCINLSICQLESIVNIVKEMNLDAIQMRVETDMPMFITNEFWPSQGMPQKLKGILLAPRVH